jgi:hypothetical protein
MQKRALFRVRLPMAASRAVKSGASTLCTFSRRGFFSSLLGGLCFARGACTYCACDHKRKQRLKEKLQLAILVADSLVELQGLTTSQVAQMLGISQDGARKLMSKLEAGHDVPIVSVDGRWQLVPYRLREAYRPITA